MAWRRSTKSKYGNKPVELMFKGKMTRFDSMKEGARALDLELMEKKGVISNLQRQTKFELRPAFYDEGKRVQAWVYKADFTYYENGEYIVEDVKGVKTQVYKEKRNQMLYRHGIRIKET